MAPNLSSGFFLAALILCLFLALVVGTGRPQTRAKRFLLLLLLAIALALLDSFWFSLHFFRTFPHSLFLFSTVWLLLPPLLYLYVAFYLDRKQQLEWLDLLHALPALVYLWLALDFYTLPATKKLAIGNALLEKSTSPGLFTLLFFGQSYAYLVWTYRLFKSRRRQWLFHWWLFWAAVVVVDSFTVLGRLAFGLSSNAVKQFIIILYACNVFFIAYKAIKRPYLLGIKVDRGRVKYESSNLTSEQIDELGSALHRTIMEGRLYLQPGLKQHQLAERLGLNPVLLSQVLNTGLRKRFNELINEYRIEHAKYLIRKDYLDGHSIEALALESGFRNKVSFYRNFKAICGETPKDYWDKVCG